MAIDRQRYPWTVTYLKRRGNWITVGIRTKLHKDTLNNLLDDAHRSRAQPGEQVGVVLARHYLQQRETAAAASAPAPKGACYSGSK